MRTPGAALITATSDGQVRTAPKATTDPRTANTTTISSTNDPSASLSLRGAKSKHTDRSAGTQGVCCRCVAQQHHQQQQQSRTAQNQGIITSSTGSRSSWLAGLSALAFMKHVARTEPQRCDHTGGEKSWMYRAISAMWDDGEAVLRSARIRAREMNDAMRDALKQFFVPLLTFTAAYISVRLPSAVIDEMQAAAKQFERALGQMHDVDCVLRASEAGYRFRDVWLKCSVLVDDDFIPVLAHCLAMHADASMALLVLAQGHEGGTFCRRSWIARTMNPKASIARRVFAHPPSSVRRVWRTHKRILRQFDNELARYIDTHSEGRRGFVGCFFGRRRVRVAVV